MEFTALHDSCVYIISRKRLFKNNLSDNMVTHWKIFHISSITQFSLSKYIFQQLQQVDFAAENVTGLKMWHDCTCAVYLKTRDRHLENDKYGHPVYGNHNKEYLSNKGCYRGFPISSPELSDGQTAYFKSKLYNVNRQIIYSNVILCKEFQRTIKQYLCNFTVCVTMLQDSDIKKNPWNQKAVVL